MRPKFKVKSGSNILLTCIPFVPCEWTLTFLKYWWGYINFENLPNLWPGDVINDIMKIDLYKCSHNLIIPMYRKCNDDIFVRFFRYHRTLRPPCEAIDNIITMTSWKILFGHYLGRSFHVSEVKFKLCSIFQNFWKWPPFWARDKLFYRNWYPKLNIPER